MSESTKHQFYHYSLRAAGTVTLTFCSTKIYAYLLPPADALELQNLYARIYIKFESGTAVADRKVIAVGVASDFVTNNLPPTQSRQIETNFVADANRIIDKTIDLTTIMFPDKVGYYEGNVTSSNDDINIVFFELPAIVGTVTTALVKIDALWTTLEIR